MLDERGGRVARRTRSAPTASPRKVSKVESKPYSRRPAAPFTTSTLQQESARKLRLSARETMRVAQSLYENGYITYMRTDSAVALAAGDHGGPRRRRRSSTAPTPSPTSPASYTGKSKNAQEAHEAIRPSGEVFRTPSELQSVLRGSEFKLYDLIWKRTVASQMADAKGQTATVTIEVGPTATMPAPEARPSRSAARRRVHRERHRHHLPRLPRRLRGGPRRGAQRRRRTGRGEAARRCTEGQALAFADLEAKGHETSPPPRYTEASLVKRLEELGIGRPSTFASIISTILDRGYVTQRGQALVPSWVAFSVVRLLEEHFGDLVEYDFTAEMEDDLDRIAAGEADRVDWLNGFYFGSRHAPRAAARSSTTSATSTPARSTRCGSRDDVTLRIGKYGPYLETVDPDAAPDATPRRVNLPADLAPDELTEAKARELIDAPVQSDRVLGANPENGKQVVAKDGRFGPYVTELEPEAETAEASVDPSTGEVVEAPKPKRGAKKAAAVKPRTASLFKSMQLEDDRPRHGAAAARPAQRVVGLDPESGEEITAQNGRYGPYLKKAADTRIAAERGRRSSTSTCRARSSCSPSRSTAPDARRAR